MGIIAYYSLLGRDKLCPMRNGWQPCIRTKRPSQQFAGSDRNCKPGSQWPPIKAQTGSTGGHNIHAANIHSHPLLYQQPRIGKEGVSCRIAQISSTKYNVCHQCFSSDFAAKHMFAPFCQLGSDWLSHFGKPLKLVGNGKLNFQPISTGIEFLEMTVEPISIKNRNLIRKAGFHFLSYAFYSDSLMSNAVAIICIFVCINMTYRPHICASKIKSVLNRSAVVHHQNHCQHCRWSNSTICLTDPISAFQSRLSAAAFFMPLSIGWLMASVPGLAPAGCISSSSTFQIYQQAGILWQLLCLQVFLLSHLHELKHVHSRFTRDQASEDRCWILSYVSLTFLGTLILQPLGKQHSYISHTHTYLQRRQAENKDTHTDLHFPKKIKTVSNDMVPWT